MTEPDLDAGLRAAMAAQQAGRLDEAEAGYRAVLEARPDHAGALQLLGVIRAQAGDFADAADLFARAAAGADAHLNQAAALRRLGRYDQAEAALRRGLERVPDDGSRHCRLGELLLETDRPAAAEDAFRRACGLMPDDGPALSGLGASLLAQDRAEAALPVLQRAAAIRPNVPEPLIHLGNALQALDRPRDALAWYDRALALRPNAAVARNNRGAAALFSGLLDQAEADLRRAVDLDPAYADARKNLGLYHLLRGDLAAGFEAYEWRWRTAEFRPRDFGRPLWDGTAAPGKTLFLHTEQGVGDVLQFVRYASLVRALGMTVVMDCHPALHRLLATAPGIDRLVAQGTPLPAFDLHCPLMSLPHRLGTTLDSVPARIPYLAPDPSAAGRWRARLAEGRARLEVGLVWAGNPRHKRDRSRSIPASSLAPLLAVSGIRFHSLQCGPHAGDTTGLPVTDHSAALTDFAETAALLAALDLLITADTAPAHLAGALGRPVWILLSAVPDWRWLMARTDSPWYPSARLFRQRRAGDWGEVIGRVAHGLQRLTTDR